MPKIVDHAARRLELAEAVWRVIAHVGVDAVSVRVVAAEAGWSPGALRYYFTTRAELLAFACAQVIDRVTERIAALPLSGNARDDAHAVLSETMPLDERRRTEAAIAFSFVTLGLSDPELAAVERRHFEEMYRLCRGLVDSMIENRSPATSPDVLARRLHVFVDGLSLQGLAGYLTREQMAAHLDAFLDELVFAG